SAERKALLEAFGAEVVFTDSLEGSDGAIRAARELAARRPDDFWYADQYNHPANPRAHYVTTAEELWRQTEGRITHFVAGLGTTGTMVGTGRRLKELNAAIELVAVQPDEPFHGLEGLKHLDTAIVPGIYDPTIPDRTEFVATEQADRMVHRLARETGLFVGWSRCSSSRFPMRAATRPGTGTSSTRTRSAARSSGSTGTGWTSSGCITRTRTIRPSPRSTIATTRGRGWCT